MSLSINLSTNIMRVAAGEPIVFAYQPASSAGIPEPLAGRAFVFAIYDSKPTSYGYFDATIVTGADPLAMWRLDGTISEGLRGSTGLRWEISERLDNGRDIIASGALNIDASAPMIGDFDSAPIARYIVRILRKNDPETIDAPLFSTKILGFTNIATVVLPAFATQPSITGSTAVGSTLTGNDGTANASISARQWLLNSTAISGATGMTYTANTAGQYSYRVTATNSAGSTAATSNAFTVAAAIPAASFTTQPSISPTSGNVGATFTATDGTVSNGSVTGRRWLLSGTLIGTGTTVVPVTSGSLVLENTGVGTNGATITATSTAATVNAVQTPTPTPAPTLPMFSAAVQAVKSKGGYARWLMIGDSLTAGLGAGQQIGGSTNTDSSLPGTGYRQDVALPAQTATALNAVGIPARADGFYGDGNSANGAATVYGPGANMNIAFGSDATIIDNLISFGGEFFVIKAESTFTPQYAANRFDFYYFASGGNAPITVKDSDGTTLGTIDTTAGTGIVKATINRSSNTVAPVRFSAGTGSYFVGLKPWSTVERRIEILNVGISGGQSQDFFSTASAWSPGNSFQVFAEVDLVTIQLGQNERSKTAAQYRTDIETLIALVKAKCPNADIQLIKTHLTNNGSADVQADKFAALDAIATAQNLATPIAFNSGVLVDSQDYNDPIHLSQTGYRREAAELVRLIATRI